MIGPPPEPYPEDTYKWADPDKTQVLWRRADLDDLWVPVTPEGTPMNVDWIMLKGWLDAGLITIEEPDPPVVPTPNPVTPP